MHTNGAGRVYISATGAIALDIRNTLVACNKQFVLQDGTPALPSLTFANNAGTGIYTTGGAGSHTIRFAANTAEKFNISQFTVTSLLSILGRDGTLGSPSYSFTNDINMGMYRKASSDLGFVVGGVLHTNMTTTTVNFVHRTAAAGTTASWTGNELIQNTSSARYKDNITTYNDNTSKFDLLRPVIYNAKPGYERDPNDPSTLTEDNIGLIAEEVHELYPEFVTYTELDDTEQLDVSNPEYGDYEDGLKPIKVKAPDGIQYDQMVSLLIHEVQKLKSTITALTTRVSELESA
jgi:hypothetical protein